MRAAEEPSDHDLLQAHARGDRLAFGALYDRHDAACHTFILRMLGRGQAALAEELHQEVWLVVATRSGTYDPTRASFGTWLFTIARHKVLDHFRRQQIVTIDTGPAAEEAVEGIADPAPGPHDQVQARELAAALVGAVEALPLAQRETFVMFAVAGLGLEEIAAATGVGVETAKSRLRYARSALKQRLQGWRPVDA